MKSVVAIAFAALLLFGCGGSKDYKSMTVGEFAQESHVAMDPADSTALVAGIAKFAIEHPDTVGLHAKKIGDLIEEGKK